MKKDILYSEKPVCFTLLPLKMDDAEDLAETANNKKIAEKLRDSFPHPYAIQDAEIFIASCIQKGDEAALVRGISVNDHVAGIISITPLTDIYRKTAELGFFLAEKYWRRGIMTNAVGQICQDAFERYHLERIFAEVFLHNTASRRVLEANGFNLEGIKKRSVCKYGQIYDSCMYALLPELSLD